MMCVASLENNFPEIRSHPHIHMSIDYDRWVQRWVPDQHWVILSLSSRFYTSTEKRKTSLLLSLQKSRACKLRSYWGTPSATWMEEQTTAEKRLMQTPGAQGNRSTAWHVDNRAHLHADHVGKAHTVTVGPESWQNAPGFLPA